MIPYGRQCIDAQDIAALDAVLRSDWLTTGPQVTEFEEALARYCGSKYAVVVSSGTAALHAAYAAAGLCPGDEFITTPITFAATATAGIALGARPVFADIDPATGSVDPSAIERCITPKTKAIVPVDYTGRPADLVSIQHIAQMYGLAIIEDACQALGAQYRGTHIGAVSDLTTFSFHPVKNITTGEGGAVVTNSEALYTAVKKFISHGMDRGDCPKDEPWFLPMTSFGLNYRITDIQCAMGISQLKKINRFLARRKQLAARYSEAFGGMPHIIVPPDDSETIRSSWHLYVIRLADALVPYRKDIYMKLHQAGIGAQVHHVPVYFHPYYEKMEYTKGICPYAEAWYERVLTLPLYVGLSQEEQMYVINTLKTILAAYKSA